MMFKSVQLPKWLPAVIGIAFFAMAATLIAQELRGTQLSDIERALQATSPQSVLVALIALAVSLTAVSSYDGWAMASLGKPKPYQITWKTSLAASALANAGGLGLALAGGARYRAYSPLGFKGAEILLMSTVVAAIGVLGGFALLGIGVADSITSQLASVHVPRIVGIVLSFLGLKLLALYVLMPRVGPLAHVLPKRWIRLGQVLSSTVEWAAAATILYAFLPVEARGSFIAFLPMFGLAGLLGAMSGLPGGIGPFDAVMLAFLGHNGATAEVLGALVLYRATYLVGPMMIIALWESLKLVPHRSAVVDTAKSLIQGEFWLAIAPVVFGVLTFVAGVVMLVSVATPDAAGRLKVLAALAPASAIDISHFIASLAGAALLFLGVGVHARMHRAYLATLCVLTIAALTTLLKGLNYEEAGFLLLIAGLMYLSRHAFYRQTRLRAGPLSPMTIVAILAALSAAAWLGFFAYQHVEYRQELWWTFLADQSAPRFLRAIVGVSTLTLVILAWRLSNPDPAQVEATNGDDLRSAEAVWSSAEDATTDGNLAFLGDKSLLFSESRKSFIQFMSHGRTWVAMGEPVGLKHEYRSMIWAFREMCDRHGAKPVFYAIRRDHLADYVDCGLVATKIGENALVPLADFTLDGARRASLRHALNRGNRDGLTFEIVPAKAFSSICDELKAVSDSWLKFHHGSEKQFSLGRFDESYLARFPTAILKRDGKIVAFSNLWSTPDGKILSIDLMRYDASAPNNTMDYLFIQLILWGKAQGYADFDLGMAPLSGLEGHNLARSVTQLGSFVFRRGEAFYGFQGLRDFKQKFNPRWEATYIAAPSGWSLLPALADVALLSNGGVLGMLKS